MRILRFFPLYVILLLWLQLQISRSSEPDSITVQELCNLHEFLKKIESELEKSRPGFLQNHLIRYVREERDRVLQLQTVGVVHTMFVAKKK